MTEDTTEEIRAEQREKCKRWREANRDRHRELNRNSYWRNPERSREQRRRWYHANKGKVKKYWSNRDARKRGAEGTHTPEEIDRIKKHQKSRCACCKVKPPKYHIDHIVPLALGGTNWARNIQLLCPSCNQSKGARDPLDFMKSRGFLL